jgi:hypothetical protein
MWFLISTVSRDRYWSINLLKQGHQHIVKTSFLTSMKIVEISPHSLTYYLSAVTVVNVD